MPTTYASSRILLPVKPWFIYASLFIAMLANFFPPEAWLWMPDWLVLLLIFWSIREQRFVGMGVSFVCGILMDVADGSLLGQHALSYVFASYAGLYLSRRILWFPLAQQALHILPVFIAVQVIQGIVRLLPGAEFPGWAYFFPGPMMSAIVWPLLTYLLLLPQYQAVDKDENRPL